MERRLTTILAADVVGYSRLMEADEAETLAALKAHREALIDPLITEHHGRVVKLMGDGALVEFRSVVDAVACALAIQDGMVRRNENIPADRRIVLRIGVHLGDVIVEGDDIYGDGVNVAARIEGAADPGCICISGTARDTIGGKLPIEFDDMGNQQLKNIDRPVRIYRIPCEGAPPPAAVNGRRRTLASSKVIGIAVTGVVLLAAGALGLWWSWGPDVEPASIEAMALPLPDKPSIAVLPFANTSGDPEQEYFADGITDDVTTDLSKLSGLFVISRNSAFAFKGQAVKIRDIAQELGVRYVLEGSVRRAGDQVRINAQLTDAVTGGNVWAERYDRRIDNIFAVQDAITGNVVKALEVRLTNIENAPENNGPATSSLEAYDLVLQARRLLTRFDHRAATEAKGLLEQAIERDPAYAQAYSLLGLFYFDEWRLWGSSRDANLSRALELAETAAGLARADPAPHILLAQIHQFRREFEAASAEADMALQLRPNEAVALANLGSMLRYAHRAKEAAEVLERAIRLDPFHPPNYLEWLGDAYFLLGRYDECIQVVERGIALDPDFVALHVVGAECYAAVGNEKKARDSGENILRANPRFTIKAFAGYVPFTEKSDLELKVRLLRAAGVPE